MHAITLGHAMPVSGDLVGGTFAQSACYSAPRVHATTLGHAMPVSGDLVSVIFKGKHPRRALLLRLFLSFNTCHGMTSTQAIACAPDVFQHAL